MVIFILELIIVTTYTRSLNIWHNHHLNTRQLTEGIFLVMSANINRLCSAISRLLVNKLFKFHSGGAHYSKIIFTQRLMPIKPKITGKEKRN